MRKIETKINIDSFPREIRRLLENATVYDSSCSSDAVVYYISSGYYVKIDAVHSLADEAALSRLFYSMGFGVEVMDYISADRDYLVTRSAVGDDLTHCLHAPEKLCEVLATALRRLHARHVDGIPLSSRYKRYMESADGDYNGGYYDESVLMKRYMVRSKAEAWSIMQEKRHLLVADTLIHGDACLPNIIQNNGRFSAFIDFNMAGAGDKHMDLYWAIWSLQYNLKTDAYTDLFLDMYGRDEINEDVLRIIAAYELFG